MIETQKDILIEFKNEIKTLRQQDKSLKSDNDNLCIKMYEHSRRNRTTVSEIPENSDLEDTDDIVKKVDSDILPYRSRTKTLIAFI